MTDEVNEWKMAWQTFLHEYACLTWGFIYLYIPHFSVLPIYQPYQGK